VAHESTVHKLASSQTTGVALQIPVDEAQDFGLHKSVVTQGLGVNVQLGAPLEFTQESVVQRLLSLHKMGVPEQRPVLGSQVPGLQGVSSQGAGVNLQTAFPETVEHESLVHKFWSSHDTGEVTHFPVVAEQD